jgi:hypothetical protein
LYKKNTKKFQLNFSSSSFHPFLQQQNFLAFAELPPIHSSDLFLLFLLLLLRPANWNRPADLDFSAGILAGIQVFLFLNF